MSLRTTANLPQCRGPITVQLRNRFQGDPRLWISTTTTTTTTKTTIFSTRQSRLVKHAHDGDDLPPLDGVSIRHSQNLDESTEDYNASDDNDTIYALSSGAGTGQATGVAVIRISGTKATTILRALCPKYPNPPPPRKATLRTLRHPISLDLLDQALVLYFPGPHSFTGEDVIELHCHGSRAVLNSLWSVLGNYGRFAEPGEFTYRAWWHGKMDVLQIEALADLLASDTDTQRTQALKQLDGQLSVTYESWRQQLIAGLAHAEAVIDFGDDERLGDDDSDDDVNGYYNSNDDPDLQKRKQEDSVWGAVIDKMDALCQSMKRQLADQRRGELVRQGVQIAIVGPPNAGKSSLFNVLANRDAAIVSPVAGTTRDVLEISLDLGGVKCILQDTAGVRSESGDLIEIEGMKRAIQAAKRADLVVAMVDSTDYSTGLEILHGILDVDNPDDKNPTIRKDTTDESRLVNPARVLLVRNKNDLVHSNATTPNFMIMNDRLLSRIGGVYNISCLTQDGIDGFLDALTKRVVGRIEGSNDDNNNNIIHNEAAHSVSTGEDILITRARHRQHIQAAVEALERFSIRSRQGIMVVDMAAEELRLAASELGRITGAVDVEDVLDKLFMDFCIGK